MLERLALFVSKLRSARALVIVLLSLPSACSLFLDTEGLSGAQSESGNSAILSGGTGGNLSSGGGSPSRGGASSVGGGAGVSASGGTDLGGAGGSGNDGGFANLGGNSAAGGAAPGGNAGVSGASGTSGAGGTSGAAGASGSSSAGAAGSGCSGVTSYDAVTMQHGIGRADDGGWGAFVAEDDPGYLAYQDVPSWGACSVTLTVHAMVASSVGPNTEVFGIGVYDLSTSRWPQYRIMYGSDVNRIGSPITFTLGPFKLPSDIRGHEFDIDVYWYDTVHVKLDSVDVELTP